jgi:alpha-D-ribose 1-methylphosphonate 5-phosphate C-P lyase
MWRIADPGQAWPNVAEVGGTHLRHSGDTTVVSLDFEGHPFEPYKHDSACELCGATDSYLDEVITDDWGSRMFVCSDTDYCEARRVR